MPSGDKSLKHTKIKHYLDINKFIQTSITQYTHLNPTVLENIAKQNKIEPLPIIYSQPVSILLKHPSSVSSFDVCPESGDVASISMDGYVTVLSERTGRCSSFDSGIFYPNFIKILPNSDKMFISALDGAVRSVHMPGSNINPGNDVVTEQLYTHNEILTGIDVTKQQKLVTLGLSGQLKLYDIDNKKIEVEFNLKEIDYQANSEVKQENKSSYGEIVNQNQLQQMLMHQLKQQNMTEINSLNIYEFFTCLDTLKVQQTKQQNILAAGTSDGRVCIFDIRCPNDQREVRSFPTKKHMAQQITDVDISEKTDTKQATPVINQKNITQYDQNAQNPFCNIPKRIPIEWHHTTSISNVLFHDQGYQVLGTHSKQAFLIDIRSEQIVQTFNIHEQYQFQTSPQTQLISGLNILQQQNNDQIAIDNNIDIQEDDLESIQNVYEDNTSNESQITDALFSSSGRILFLAVDNNVIAFDVLYGTQIGYIATHSAQITKIALTNDKAELLSAGHDAQLRKWAFQSIGKANK